MNHLLMSEFPFQPILKSQSYIGDRSVFPEDQWNWYIHLHLVDLTINVDQYTIQVSILRVYAVQQDDFVVFKISITERLHVTEKLGG